MQAHPDKFIDNKIVKMHTKKPTLMGEKTELREGIINNIKKRMQSQWL